MATADGGVGDPVAQYHLLNTEYEVAVAFAYFETLIRLGDRNRLAEEVARMTSFNNFLRTVGGYSDLVTDMADEAIDLLRTISASIADAPGAAELILAQRFADANIGSYIIAHFRYLAASWLKKYPDEYQGFIADIGIDEYCRTTLEPSHEEIDHVGMKLLIDVLLRPIGISVVIAHLDRSAGSEVNHHQFPADESIGVQEPIIYLLFRPTHYDILYKDLPQQPQQLPLTGTSLQVNRAAFQQRHTQRTMDPFSIGLDMNALASIPALDLPPQPFNPVSGSHIDQSYAASSSISPISPDGSMTAFPSSSAHISPGFSSQPAPSPSLLSPTMISPHPTFVSSNIEMPIEAILDDRRGSATSLAGNGGTFRPSKYEWEAAAEWQEPPAPTFTTSTFKNSHYNTAHYQNPNFHPEEWTPDMDETVHTSHRKKSH